MVEYSRCCVDLSTNVMAFCRFRRKVLYVWLNWKYNIKNQKPKSMKIAIFALMLATAAPMSAHVNEKWNEVIKIEKVGAFKFLVNASSHSNASVIIRDVDNNIIHREYLNKITLFNFNSLQDGKYTLQVLDSRKNVIETKAFEINTQVKRDLVTIK